MRRFQPRRRIRADQYRNIERVWPQGFFFAAFIVLAGGWIAYALGNRDVQIGSLITASIAAASIVYSLSRGQDATKDQYTLTLIAKRFEDGDYATNVRIASELKRAGTLTAQSTVADLFAATWRDPNKPKDTLNAAYAVIPILNYWEHVCTAYVDNRINRQIFEDLVEDLILDLVRRYQGIIGSMRREDSSNMEHLCTVWFVIAPDHERNAMASKLGAVPQRLCADDCWRWQASTKTGQLGEHLAE